VNQPTAVSTVVRTMALLTVALCLATGQACSQESHPSFASTLGIKPSLPPPDKALVPTINVAKAAGWPDGKAPVAAQGLRVTAFATGLAHPRWVYVLPDGGVLVAETSAPERPDEGKGFRGRIMSFFMKRAGSAEPSANRIALLRDDDRDGVAETRSVFLAELNSPLGMALVGDSFYVANTDGIVRFPYEAGQTAIAVPAVNITDLPAGTRNHHWTKNIVASRDGSRLYATVGSNSNAAENGMEVEEGRAAIWEVSPADGSKRLFATGLRNPNGMDWEPDTGVLWTVVNERDELGNDLVPDFLTSVRDGAFYGWPYSYFGAHVDDRVKPPRPDLVASAISPDYSLGSHVAALGVAFSDGKTLGPPFASGAFIGQHGSWNREPRSGYNVVFVRFEGGKPAGEPVEILTGFITEDGTAYGRPVGVAVDGRGGLLVVDDVGDTVWRVVASQ